MDARNCIAASTTPNARLCADAANVQRASASARKARRTMDGRTNDVMATLLRG
jgi:hypothetical protein